MASVAPIFTAAAAAASTDPLVTELRKENAALKKEIVQLKKENDELSKKRKSIDNADANGPASKKAKTPAQRKKLFEKWAKALARESAKTKLTNVWGSGESYAVKVSETTPWQVAEFESIFGGKGVKIQPTKTNKPTSTITVLEFDDMDSIKDLFGEAAIEQEGYKASQWRSRSFKKSYKCGDLSAKINKLQVHFNKSKLSLMLQFYMETTGEDY